MEVIPNDPHFTNMTKQLIRVARVLSRAGLNPRPALRAIQDLGRFFRTYREFRVSSNHSGPFGPFIFNPCLGEHLNEAGSLDRHYFLQDLWFARRIYQARPTIHYDVGSRIDGFVAHVLTFMSVCLIDVRELTIKVEGLRFLRDNAVELKTIEDNSVDSLSSLHSLEHFGLGRYGDPIDAECWRKTLKTYYRKLAPGGRLYLSVPVGRQRIEFNAHRVFNPTTIPAELNAMQLIAFAVINDQGTLEEDVEPADFSACDYACGMYVFQK